MSTRRAGLAIIGFLIWTTAAAATEPPAVRPLAPSTLLVVNNGRPGPLRGVVPVKIDARAHADLAYVILRVGEREAFLSNAAITVRQWDTRAFPDGTYTVVAEAYDKYTLLERSYGEVFEIRNDTRAGATATAPAPRGGLPDPTWKSITVASPNRALRLPERLSLRGDRSFVPLRRVVETAGGTVEWTPPSRSAGAAYRANRATVTIRSRDARKGGRVVRLEYSPYLRDARTQIGARALAELLELRVEWLHEAKSVRLVAP